MEKISSVIKIIGHGVSLPEKEILSAHIDKEMGYEIGLTERVTGVKTRYYSTGESATELACPAIKSAIKTANMSYDDIDCIIGACGTNEQAIPYNASKVHGKLSFSPNVVAFDINMTCLSSLMAVDLAKNLLETGRYKNILIYASDLASVGVNWREVEVGGLFGDGAAALILTRMERDNLQPMGAKIISSLFETHSEAVDYCQIKGGGSLNPPSKVKGNYLPFCQFEMQGKKLYRYSANVLEIFIKKLLDHVNLDLADIDWVVPHQASGKALELMQKRLDIPKEKMINIISNHGNQISASIPTAYSHLLTSGNLKSGDKILLIGTSAGLSLGGMILEW